MADAVAWQRYAGKTRPVTVKQRVQEASVAHLDRVEATGETGEATVTGITVKRTSSTTAFRRLQWAKRAGKSGISTTASRQNQRANNRGQRLTG